MRLPAELRRFAQLERVLGVLLMLTPVLLVCVDTGSEAIRDSISAYHDVSRPWAFYVPLTAGAMLFLVNGVVRNAHAYNSLLGVALFGVILFDHDGGTSAPHVLFAIAFFGGNFLVMAFLSTNKSALHKGLLVGGVAAAIALWIFVGVFWAECVSLAIITLHYVLHSASWSNYRALRHDETPKLVPTDR